MSVLETNSCEHHLQLNGRKYSVYLFIIYFDFLIISLMKCRALKRRNILIDPSTVFRIR